MNPSSAPPRYLLGTALLFWSAMTGQWLIGVPLAVVVEIAHWVPLRWNFEQPAVLRAWHLSIVLVAARMVLTLFEDSHGQMIPRLAEWGPLLLFPLQFTQSYGLRDRIPLYTFSILARKRWDRNFRLGIFREPATIHFGHVYLVAVVLGAALGRTEDSSPPWTFLGGLVLLAAWAFIAMQRNRLIALGICLTIASAFSFAGMFGMKSLYRWSMRGHYGVEDNTGYSQYNTAIGDLGELKQSTKILWRMKTTPGFPAPRLLRTMAYNQYDRGAWRFRKPGNRVANDADFIPLRNIEPVPGKVYYLTAIQPNPDAISPTLPRISLRGEVRSRMALPVTGNVASLTGFEVDRIERNNLGTFRIEPKEAILSGEELSDPRANPEAPPGDGSFELKVPPDEREAVRSVVDELNLRALPLDEKIEALRTMFNTRYHYTRYLSIPRLSRNSEGGRSAMTQFLTTNHSGHCEYFATAATLILRDAGVPTRYAVGYSVSERDPSGNEYVIRGIHTHAWCRFWDERQKLWIDFDATPPGWLKQEPDRMPWDQKITDLLQRNREDFFLWRNQPENAALVGMVVSAMGLLGAAAIARNLWKSRHRVKTGPTGKRPDPAVRTPLHDLEPLARRWLGERPPGMPYGRWLRGLGTRFPETPAIAEAVNLHQQLRFDPSPPPAGVGERLAELEKEVRALLKARKRS